MNEKISVICVYNNQEQLDNCLLKGLKKQNIDYELVLVYGSKGKFKSCATALNYGASQAHGDIFIFSHQDVCLKIENELNDLASFITKAANGSMVGVAGAVERYNERK